MSEKIVPDPKAKILQLGVLELSPEITGCYMKVRGEVRAITYDKMWEAARPKMKGGKPSSVPRQLAICAKYGLPHSEKFSRLLTVKFMDQLDRCKSESARRLLLGCSR